MGIYSVCFYVYLFYLMGFSVIINNNNDDIYLIHPFFEVNHSPFVFFLSCFLPLAFLSFLPLPFLPF